MAGFNSSRKRNFRECFFWSIGRNFPKPFGNKISEKEQLKMVGAWEIENEHPLVQSVIEAAKAIITNEPLSVEKTLGLLSQVWGFS